MTFAERDDAVDPFAGSFTVQAWRAIMDRARQARMPVVGHLPIRVDAVEAVESGQRCIEHFGNAWAAYC
jgi:hypothetical protein